jgi:hypothetical protein
VTGFVGSDSGSLNTTGISLVFDSAHVQTASKVSANGSYTVGFTGKQTGTGDGSAGNQVAGDLSDYQLPSATQTIGSVSAQITPALLTVTAPTITAVNKTYDGLLAATGSTLSGGSVTGFVGSDSGSLNTTGISLVFDSAHVQTASKVSANGSYTVSFTGKQTGTGDGSAGNQVAGDLSDYQLPSATQTIGSVSAQITPALLGITVSGNYSGTNTISPANFTVTGLVFGQTIASISSAVVNSPNVSSNGANYVTSINGVSGSALMSDYYITPSYNGTLNQATTNVATITPAPLTITAANDAKFVTQTDTTAYAYNCGSGPCAGGYMGLIFNGFVNGQTAAILSGSPSIVRTNAGVNSAGSYSSVLQPGGYSADNYSIKYVNGDYVIVPANTLLVRVNPALVTYGSVPLYSASAAYLANDGSTIVNLSPSISGSSISAGDGVGGSASFNLSMIGASTSTSGNVNVGSYNLGPINTNITGSNFNNLIVVGSATVQPYTLKPSQLGISSVSKVYDGNVNIGALVLNTDPTLSSVLGSGTSKDQVTILGSGIFTDNPNVGTGKNVAISLSLAGADSNNYVLSSNVYSANIGTITQLPSVTWVGPTSGGNWSNASNWAGGAIPTLSNVANVIIPSGATVNFDTAGLVGNLPTSSITANGTLSFANLLPFNLINSVSGSGIISQSGAGVLTLSGNNSGFTGSVNLNNATLVLASNNALGSGSINSTGGQLSVTAGTTLSGLTVYGGVILTSDIPSTGAQTYNGAITIAPSSGSTLTISSIGSPINFNGTIDGALAKADSLIVNAGAGVVTIANSVGSLARLNDLTITGSRINVLADILTGGAQTYNGDVYIGDATFVGGAFTQGFLYNLYSSDFTYILDGVTSSIKVLDNNSNYVRTMISEDPSITFNGLVNDTVANTHTLLLAAISPNSSALPTISFTPTNLGASDKYSVGGIAALYSLNVQTIQRGAPSEYVGQTQIIRGANTYSDQTYRSAVLLASAQIPSTSIQTGDVTFSIYDVGSNLNFLLPLQTAGAGAGQMNLQNPGPSGRTLEQLDLLTINGLNNYAVVANSRGANNWGERFVNNPALGYSAPVTISPTTLMNGSDQDRADGGSLSVAAEKLLEMVSQEVGSTASVEVIIDSDVAQGKKIRN